MSDFSTSYVSYFDKPGHVRSGGDETNIPCAKHYRYCDAFVRKKLFKKYLNNFNNSRGGAIVLAVLVQL
jgi:hypothetical protein